jgi:sugar lactone lactonase YvrE
VEEIMLTLNRMLAGVGLGGVLLGTVFLAGCSGEGQKPNAAQKSSAAVKDSCCAGDQKTAALLKPVLLFKLEEKHSSPDGMCLGKDGNIYLSMNNKNTEFKSPCKIMRITADDKLEDFCELPGHPDTKICSPLGIGFGSDGNLYVSDNQLFVKDAKMGTSRVLRVVIKDGKAEKVETVVTGLNMANGLACKGDCVYVNDTTLGSTKPMPSGVYCFKISELKADAPVAVTGLNDSHLILKVETENADPLYQVGANGLDFDSKGNMYVCDFGDAEIMKVTFDADGKVMSTKSLAKGGGMQSADGCHTDLEGNLWVADFMGNAIARVNCETGAVTVVAKNEPGDGADGSLDAPSECIRRGDKVYVSNIDITYGPNAGDAVHTMSVISLKK